MDREALVYVDLDGVPHLMGRLWARTRKNKESASFEHDKGMDGKSRAILWSRLCRLLPACFTRRQTRPCSAAVGDSTPDRWGVRSCPAWNAGARSGERGTPRTLKEIDFLLLVDDEARGGALRFAESKADPSCGRGASSASPPADRTSENCSPRPDM